MKRWKAIAGILVIFLLGAMSGVLGTSLVVKHRIEMFHEKGPPSFKPLFMSRFGNRLDLTQKQRMEVGRILDSLHLQLRQLRHDFHPKVKTAFDNAFKEIEEKLTPSQKQKMEQLLKEWPRPFRFGHHHRHEDHRGFDKPAPPPPGASPGGPSGGAAPPPPT